MSAPHLNGSTSARDRQAAARRVYLASVAEGDPISGAELGRRFDRSAQWGRALVARVRAEGNGHGDRQGGASGRPVGDVDRQGVDMAGPVAGDTTDTGDMAALDGRQPARHWQDSAITLVVALVAAAASYRHMLDVALMAGEPLWVARAFPITVDGLVLAALRRGERGRAWLALGLVVSVAANVVAQFPELAADAGPVVSAWPPLALYGTHRLLHRRS